MDTEKEGLLLILILRAYTARHKSPSFKYTIGQIAYKINPTMFKNCIKEEYLLYDNLKIKPILSKSMQQVQIKYEKDLKSRTLIIYSIIIVFKSKHNT